MDNLTTITVQVTPDQLISIAKILGGQSPQAKAKRQTRDKIGTKPTKTKTKPPKAESKPDQLPEHLMDQIISPDAYSKPKKKQKPLDQPFVTTALDKAPLPEYPTLTFNVLDDFFSTEAPRDPTALRDLIKAKADFAEMTVDEMVEDMLQ